MSQRIEQAPLRSRKRAASRIKQVLVFKVVPQNHYREKPTAPATVGRAILKRFFVAVGMIAVYILHSIIPLAGFALQGGPAFLLPGTGLNE